MQFTLGMPFLDVLGKFYRHRKIKSKSNQIKSLLLSHHHSTSALVSEILMSVLQTVQKQQTIYLWTDSAKKTTDNLHMDRQCKKNNRQFTYGQTVQKKQQTIYIWTDSAKKTALEHLQCSRQCKKNHNNSNLHMDRQCKGLTCKVQRVQRVNVQINKRNNTAV